MKNLTIVLALISVQLLTAQNKLPFELEKDWELLGFENPESVVLDAQNNILYVSNVNGAATDKDANGYISKVSLEGEIIQQKWITGLNAPKGLTLYNDKLYATDIDEIIEINIKNGKKTHYKVEGATFLNDIAVDKKGNIYASNTFGFSAIYKLSNKKVISWIKSEKLNLPNGLYIQNDNLYVATWGASPDAKTYETLVNGKLIQIDLEDKTITDITNPIGNLDGLEATIHGFLISDWLAGKLLYYSNESKTIIKALDLPKGSADIHFNKTTKSVFIPLMLDNKLLKYHFKK